MKTYQHLCGICKIVTVWTEVIVRCGGKEFKALHCDKCKCATVDKQIAFALPKDAEWV